MELMIFCGIYLVELVCYLAVLRMLFDVQVRTKVWMVVGILVPVVICGLPVSAAGKNFLVSISVVIVMYITMEGKLAEKGIKLILTFLIVECMDGIFLIFRNRVASLIVNIYITNIGYLILKCCTMIGVSLLSIIKKNMSRYKKVQINSTIYLIIGVIATSMIFCLGILDQVKVYLPNVRFIVICNILNIAICISIFLLVVFIIYIKITHERMEQLLETERLLKESQVNYYKQVLKKENDTRKYRHDMMNHLVYIHDVLDKRRIDDAQRYLNSILGGFKKIQNTYYVTGNEMIDTIINYFFGMLPKDVTIDINRCPVEIDMEETEICTIFSNLFQNAVEELTENRIKDAFIKVHAQKGKQYVEYHIINSLSRKIDIAHIDKNGLPKSHKEDKRNHGVGMVNVKKAIDRNNGKFEWKQGDSIFCVYIILPIK